MYWSKLISDLKNENNSLLKLQRGYILNVMVTGGAGYIGSHTCKILKKLGHNPIVLDDLSSGNEWAVKWGPLVAGDISDKALVMSTVKKYNITALIHFAAHAYVGESIKNPQKYFQNNVIGSINLFDAIMDMGVDKIVFSSTCAVYGVPKKLPIFEKHSCQPINPYGESKLFIERVLKWYGKQSNLKWVALRYFNAAGADPDCDIGEWHVPETHLIPRLLDIASKQKDLIEVYGDDYDTFDGTCIRDYIHVEDLAKAHILALNYLNDSGSSQSFNLGNGDGYSVHQVIKAVREVTGKDIPIKIKPRRIGDPPVLISDSSNTIDALGWEPKYSSLETQIDHAWQWFRKINDKNFNNIS